MKKIILLSVFLFVGFCVSAQEYITPNTGVHWNLDSLIQHSPETVSLSNNVYRIAQDFTVAENDTLTLNKGTSIHIDEDVRLTVEGKFFSRAEENDEILITATDSLTPYDGFRFEENSEIKFDYTVIKNGGGLKVITTDFALTNCKLFYNVSGVATGGVISLSHGSPLIRNNTFIKNATPAVSSPANQEVSAKILDNYLEGNGQSNQNRPQINMGTTGADTLKIMGNTIIGDRNLDQVGGIATSNLMGTGSVIALIKDNTIIDNRYGITVAGGNAYVEITGNVIEDNDTQGLPNLGGSGISLNSPSNTQTIMATGNEIRNNLWGITLLDQASINLGDDNDNPGNNVFSENGNNGQVYALYNNTPNTILAKHNCWIEGQENTLEDAAEVIFDQADDPSLGEVIYDPVGCGEMSVATFTNNELSIYPNPAKNELHFSSDKHINEVIVFSIEGKQVMQSELTAGQTTLPLNLPAGIYIVQFNTEGHQIAKKLIVQ